MNRENILKVADAIEQHSIRKLGFNMNVLNGPYHLDHSGHNCGTCACIAGWTCAVNKVGADFDTAESLLGIDRITAGRLFWGENTDRFLSTISQAEAVATLRHLAETGEVDWDRALSETATPIRGEL